MSKNYVIIEASEVDSVDFSQVLETSAETIRYNLAGNKTFVKFEGDTPSFLEGKELKSYSEMRSILATEEWTDPNIDE